jgi:hypothetical protein
MTKKMTIEEHLWNVSTFTGQIANIGIAIPNEELVDRVLTSLPSSWDTLRQMISGREHPLTYGNLESMLLQEDSIRQRSREEDDTEEAMLIQQKVMYSCFQPCGRCSSFRGRSNTQRGRSFNNGNLVQAALFITIHTSHTASNPMLRHPIAAAAQIPSETEHATNADPQTTGQIGMRSEPSRTRSEIWR